MKKIFSILLLLSITMLLGCNSASKIQNGDIVTITYTGTLENGEIFESETKTITIGSGEIIKGIENSLKNKKSDQQYKITIKPEDGYQYLRLSHKQKEISKNSLQKLGHPTEIGSNFELDGKQGTIVEHKQDEKGNITIIFDTNPKQTRQKTIYNIHIKKFEKSEKNNSEYSL